MRIVANLLASLGLGAGLMYLLDPQGGKRRRALIRDKAVHGVHVTEDAAGKISRDMRNRAQGFTSSFKQIAIREEVSDEVLADRVRSRIGGVVGHPGSIHVEASNGHIRLSGVVLSRELKRLIKKVKSVRGVREVEHGLEVHEEPGNVPGLQGEPSVPLTGERFELLQENWTPAARLVTGLAGGALTVYGLIYRGISGAAAATTGLPLMVRAATNMPLRRLVGLSGRRGIDIKKTVNIHAPIEEVFSTLRNSEDFPKFMTHVKEVVRLDADRFRWTLSGPAGIPVQWTSAITSAVPNEEIAWKTEGDSMVQHEGVARLVSNPDGSTTVNIRMTYNPLVGGIGHTMVKALGSDPKTLLDDEFARFKTYLETGKQPRDAAARAGY